jgi:hypothetical protein
VGRFCRHTLLFGLLAAATALVPAGAHASGWTLQSVPEPRSHNSHLLGVSCSSGTACTAVGHYVNGAGTQMTLAERWNGRSWRMQYTPNPTGARSSELADVSCTSASTCIAVGDYVNGSGTQLSLAEQWNGGVWSIQTTPGPAGAEMGVLLSVACTSAVWCTAAGDYLDSRSEPFTLAQQWSTGAWATRPAASPVGTEFAELAGVSCTSSSACVAVGHYLDGLGSPRALVDRWNGRSWTEQPLPTPAAARSTELLGVICTPAACTAVGGYVSGAGAPMALAESWSGSAWTIESPPTPAGAREATLTGVSCSATATCVAVGRYREATGTQLPLAEQWDGARWALTPTTPTPEASFATLRGVSCGGGSCTAVGWQSTHGAGQALAESYAK